MCIARRDGMRFMKLPFCTGACARVTKGTFGKRRADGWGGACTGGNNSVISESGPRECVICRHTWPGGRHCSGGHPQPTTLHSALHLSAGGIDTFCTGGHPCVRPRSPAVFMPALDLIDEYLFIFLSHVHDQVIINY